jgi:hypothetical protein
MVPKCKFVIPFSHHLHPSQSSIANIKSLPSNATNPIHPQSSTCVPVSGTLLSPLSHQICPLASERYELRTATLGCNCSTYTLLSIIITVFSTIGALVLVSVVLWLLKWWGRTMRSGGWEIVVEEDGRVREGTWRRGALWPRWMVARR